MTNQTEAMEQVTVSVAKLIRICTFENQENPSVLQCIFTLLDHRHALIDSLDQGSVTVFHVTIVQ